MYCTIQQLEDRLTAPILAQRVIETGPDRLRVLTSYIERASAHIDATLAVRYPTPLPPHPMLSGICLDLCIWQIEADRGSFSDKMPAGTQVPYDNAITLLTSIAKGAIALPGASASTSSSAGLLARSPVSLFSPGAPGMGDY